LVIVTLHAQRVEEEKTNGKTWASGTHLYKHTQFTEVVCFKSAQLYINCVVQRD